MNPPLENIKGGFFVGLGLTGSVLSFYLGHQFINKVYSAIFGLRSCPVGSPRRERLNCSCTPSDNCGCLNGGNCSCSSSESSSCPGRATHSLSGHSTKSTTSSSE